LLGARTSASPAASDELEGPGLRLTYDQGDLEIVPTSHRHERWKTLVGRMIEAMTEELGIPIHGAGSMTFRRRNLKKGLEPDECYWIQNERAMRARSEYDPDVDPPPDLAIEVEISRNVLNRLAVYSALEIPEVWRYDGRTIRVLLRDKQGEYQETKSSKSLPLVPVAELARFLELGRTLGETQVSRQFRAWVREQQVGGWRAKKPRGRKKSETSERGEGR